MKAQAQNTTPLNHLGIIMDGNGRWAEAQGMPRVVGHKQGAQNLRTIVSHVRSLNIPYLTFYAFSTENWKRKEYEVNAIMQLFRRFTRRAEIKRMNDNDIRVRFIGRRDRLPSSLLETMIDMEQATAGGTAMLLMIAIDYGGRDEIVRAANQLRDSDELISELSISAALDTAPAPDPDLVIRTGGNTRTSNFLTWQTVYSEWFFTQTMWPDFKPSELDMIVDLYAGVERRFGDVLSAAAE